jgi:hypothetical protein
MKTTRVAALILVTSLVISVDQTVLALDDDTAGRILVAAKSREHCAAAAPLGGSEAGRFPDQRRRPLLAQPCR